MFIHVAIAEAVLPNEVSRPSLSAALSGRPACSTTETQTIDPPQQSIDTNEVPADGPSVTENHSHERLSPQVCNQPITVTQKKAGASKNQVAAVRRPIKSRRSLDPALKSCAGSSSMVKSANNIICAGSA